MLVHDSGGAPHEFDQVWDVRTGTDKRVYVLDAKRPAVFEIDSTGRVLRQIGNVGQGPGEYVWPTSIAVTNESVVLWDAALRRLSRFNTLTGTTTSSVYGKRAHVSRVAGYSDGTLLFQIGPRWYSPPDSLNGRLALAILDSGGNAVKLLVQSVDSSSVALVRPGFSSVAAVPFAARPVWALASNDDVWFADGATYQIFVLNRAGDTVMTVLREQEGIRPNRDELNSARQKVASYADGLREQVRLPHFKSSVKAMRPQPAGCMWVSSPDRTMPGADRWDVFLESGAFVTSLLIDTSTTLLAVDDAKIYAAIHDSLDLVRVGSRDHQVQCLPIRTRAP